MEKKALHLIFEMKREFFDKSTVQFPGKYVTNIMISFDSKVKQVNLWPRLIFTSTELGKVDSVQLEFKIEIFLVKQFPRDGRRTACEQ